MKLSNARGFVNQLLVAALLTIGFSGSVGLGTVWLRHQISVVADANRDLEQRRHDVERRIDDVTAQVESALSPDVLRSENQAMQLGLIGLSQGQIVPVSVDPISRLVARANRHVFERDGTGSRITVRVNLPSTAQPDGEMRPIADDPGAVRGIRSAARPAAAAASYAQRQPSLDSRSRGQLATNP